LTSQHHDDHPDVLAAVLGSLLGTFTVAAFAYLGALGFAGGTVPLLGWHLAGMALCAAVARVRPARRGTAAARRPVRRVRPLKQAA